MSTISKSRKSFPDDDLELYFKELSKSSSRPLSTEEEQQLSLRIRRGDVEARNQLVAANLRFAVDVAKRFQNQGLAMGDLISAANRGLITAAERFDGARGFKFVSYAVWWIRQAILQALAAHGRTVRLPTNQLELLHNMRVLTQELTGLDGAAPSVEDFASELEIAAERVAEIMGNGQPVVSLDEPLEPGQETTLLHLMEADTPPAYTALEEEGCTRDIQESLDSLEPREALILRLYFGLGGEESLKLDEIGREINLTKERVRQIKEKALAKMRHPGKAKKLRIHWGGDGDV